MAEKLRIRKLAQRLDRPPEEILDILHELGELRYRTPADMLSDEVMIKIEQALAAKGIVAPPPKKREPPPPREEPAAPRPLATPAAPQGAAAPSFAPPTAAAPQEPRPAPAPPAPAAPPAVRVVEAPKREAAPAPASTPEEEEEDEDTEPDFPLAAVNAISELQTRVSELTHALEEAHRRDTEAHALERIAIDRLAPAEMRSRELQRQLEAQRTELQGHVDLVQQRLNRSEAQLRSQVVVELTKATAQRGIESPEDVKGLLALLLDGEWQRRTLEHLRVVEEDRFVRLLKAKVVLWCGDVRCALPEGMLGLPVSPASRCEVCQGKEMLHLSERLVLACRAHKANIRRITLIGGQEREVAEFMKAVSGRLDIRWVEPGATRTEEQALAEAAETHITVLWSGSHLPHRLAAAYAAVEGLMVVKAPGLTGFLDDLAGQLAAGAVVPSGVPVTGTYTAP